MALERKPQNLRGYGLAQDPKVELDTSFVDDQNRRMYQKKGIEAQQEAQQKNFAQRDRETRVDLLKGIPTIESNWSPKIKSKINAEIDAFIKGAGDLSTEEIVVGLNGLKSKAGAYKSIGTALKDRATKVATGEIYSGLDGDKLLGLKLEKDFANLTFEEAMTKAMNITQSQFAPMPDMTQWETLKNNVYDFAKLSSTGEMEYAGNLGDKSYGRFAFKVDPNAKKAAVSNFMTGNRGFYNLYAEKNDLDSDEIESTLSSQIEDMVFGKWAENRPRADKEPRGFRATGSGWADGVYNYTKGSGSSETNNPDAIGELSKQNAEGETIIETIGYENVVISRDNKDIAVKEIPFYDKDGELINGSIREIRQYPNGYKEIVVSRDGMTELLPYEKNKAILLGEYNLSESRVGEMLKKENGTKESEVGRSNNQKSAIKAFGQEKFDGLSDDLKKKFLEKYK